MDSRTVGMVKGRCKKSNQDLHWLPLSPQIRPTYDPGGQGLASEFAGRGGAKSKYLFVETKPQETGSIN